MSAGGPAAVTVANYIGCSITMKFTRQSVIRDVKFAFSKIRTLFVKFEFVFEFVLLYQHERSLGLQSQVECNKIAHRPPVAISRRRPSLVFDAQVRIYSTRWIVLGVGR